MCDPKFGCKPSGLQTLTDWLFIEESSILAKLFNFPFYVVQQCWTNILFCFPVFTVSIRRISREPGRNELISDLELLGQIFWGVLHWVYTVYDISGYSTISGSGQLKRNSKEFRSNSDSSSASAKVIT